VRWLTSLSSWVLAATAVIALVFGLTDIPTATPDNAVSVTGQTADQLAASQPQAYALLQHEIRAGGVQLAVLGLFALAVFWFGFRQRQRWAWWTLWLLPVWAGAASVLAFTAVGAGQSPAVHAYSGLLFTGLDVAALLVAARSFFGRAGT